MAKRSNVLICVTRQRSCERLIRVGSEASEKSNGKTLVIHVAPLGENFLGNPKEGDALEYLFDISKQFGAEMTVLRSDDFIDVITEFSRERKVGTIVLGESPGSKGDSQIIKKLKRTLTDIEIIVVPA